MNAFNSLGRLIFPAAIIILGILHIMNAPALAQNTVPDFMPAKDILPYLSGALLIFSGATMYMGKYDKIGANLLSLYILAVVILVHIPAALKGGVGAEIALTSLIKDLAIMAGSMMYSKYVAEIYN